MDANFISALKDIKRKSRLAGRPITEQEVRGVTSGYFEEAGTRLAQRKALELQEKDILSGLDIEKQKLSLSRELQANELAVEREKLAELRRGEEARLALERKKFNEQVNAAQLARESASSQGKKEMALTGGILGAKGAEWAYGKMFGANPEAAAATPGGSEVGQTVGSTAGRGVSSAFGGIASMGSGMLGSEVGAATAGMSTAAKAGIYAGLGSAIGGSAAGAGLGTFVGVQSGAYAGLGSAIGMMGGTAGGTAAGAAAGTAAGSGLGAALGNFVVPVIGAVVGGILGSLIGGDDGICLIISSTTGEESYEVKLSREFRDKYMGPFSIRGYKTLARLITPLMKKLKLTAFVKSCLTDHLVDYGEAVLGHKAAVKSRKSIYISRAFLFLCRLFSCPMRLNCKIMMWRLRHA